MTVTEDPGTNVRLVRGELLHWSELHAADRCFIGRATWPLLSDRTGQGVRALVLGPHDPELVGHLLKSGAHVTVLLRSYPDAQELSRQFYDSTQLLVECGAFQRFT